MGINFTRSELPRRRRLHQGWVLHPRLCRSHTRITQASQHLLRLVHIRSSRRSIQYRRRIHKHQRHRSHLCRTSWRLLRLCILGQQLISFRPMRDLCVAWRSWWRQQRQWGQRISFLFCFCFWFIYKLLRISAPYKDFNLAKFIPKIIKRFLRSWLNYFDWLFLFGT